MEYIEVKKVNYEVLEQVNSYILRVRLNEEEYLVYDFSSNKDAFFDFRFAYKRLSSSGITMPKIYKLDKKSYRALIEDIKGETVFDLLQKEDLNEKIIEQVFILNYKARINRIRLNFDPVNFIFKDNKLYYTPFTFTQYDREEDFTQKEIRLWFYTNEFKNKLIEKGLPVNQSRMKNEYERNKEIVLTVVKYFR